MTIGDALRLILLSAIWGASFLFMRIAAPHFGPFPMIFVRIGGAALVLLPIVLRPSNRAIFARYKGSLFLLGLLNSAIPFSLIGWAALRLDAGFTSLLNASTPIFTAVIGFLWLGVPLLRSQILGLALGVVGIGILTGNQLSFAPGGLGWPIIAVLLASCSYGFAGHFVKRNLGDVSTLIVSAGSLFCSTFILAPLALLFPPPALPGWGPTAAALALAVVCTAFAFVLFFDILKRTGATAATTVTFVVPVFGVLWGALFLREEVTLRMGLGMAIALLGTALVTRLFPRRKMPAAAA